MHKVHTVRIKNFRRLGDLELHMRPLMVMIGANGVGKTTVLDALNLLSSSAGGVLGAKLVALGGVDSLLTRNRERVLSYDIDSSVPGYPDLRYALEIESIGQGYTIRKETLTQAVHATGDPLKLIDSRSGNVRFFNVETKHLEKAGWDLDPNETSLSQIPKLYRQPEELRRTLGSATLYNTLDVSSQAAVKMPQMLRPAGLPGANGETLISFLYGLREAQPDRFDAVIDTLKGAFPSFETLAFPPAAAGVLSMTWKDRDFGTPFYPHELSEGTLRFLWLVALLHSPNLSTITMLDEPEVSLHPEMLGILADLFREASKRTQLIIATHSDRLVRFLKPEEVLVLDNSTDGLTAATWADSMDLEAWLEDYGLDEVWRMGRLGGRS